MVSDLKLSFRQLSKSPVFTTIAVLTLAIGIGANLAIFSFVNAYLLKPLPYDGADRLTVLIPVNRSFGTMSVAYTAYQDWRELNQCFESMACARMQSYTLTGRDQAERLSTIECSASTLPMLGVRPALGRLFTPEDDHGTAARTVMLSHAAWERLFQADRGALEQSIQLNGELFTVIGVLPEGFQLPTEGNEPAAFWVPIGLHEADPDFLKRWNHNGIFALGKRRIGVTLEQAQADMDRVAGQILEQYPNSMDHSIRADDLRSVLTQNWRSALFVLLAAVAGVLLIVCVNLAGLLLVRATRRQPEFAIRAALGGGRWDIIKQLLRENALLLLFGAAVGVVVARWGADLLYAFIGDRSGLPATPAVLLERNMAFFFAGMILCAGALFGLFPALQASMAAMRPRGVGALHRVTTGRAQRRVGEFLVVAEVALALVILSGAGLMVRSYQNYLAADPGYNPDQTLTLQLSLPAIRYPDRASQQAFLHELHERVAALPNVRHAGLASRLLGGNQTTYTVAGAPAPQEGQTPFTERAYVTPDFINAMGMRLISGRQLSERDGEGSPPVALVDERFVQRWWPNESPIGQRFQFGGQPDPDKPWIEVVGVVSHVKSYGVDQDSREGVYLPTHQHDFSNVTLVVRCLNDPLALADQIRQVVGAIDSDLAVSRIATLQTIIGDQSYMRRLLTSLLGVFALVALLLAALGLYGITAYAVEERTREFGIRSALGAQRLQLLRLVLGNGLKLGVFGTAVGLVGAIALNRLLQSQLFGVTAHDPAVFTVIALLLLGIAALACSIPAHRATRINPVEALRAE